MAEPLGFVLSGLTGLPPSRLAALAVRAEQRGFSTLALTESYSDVVPLAAAVASQTNTATIATTIANVGFRHPALLALSAASVDELSGGRLVLGLSVGTQWFDRRAVDDVLAHPLAALTEYLDLLRQLWASGTENTQSDGAFYRLDPFHLDLAPLRPRIPIYLAAMGRGMLRLAGRLADGVFLGLIPIDQIPAAVAEVRDAAAAAGRDPAAVTIAMLVRTCLDDDLDRAREGVRASIPLYLTFPGYARYFQTLGYGAVVAAVQTAYARGTPAAALSTIPDELVDRVGGYGPASDCRATLARFRATGLDLPIVSARRSADDWVTTLQQAIDTLAP